MEVVPSELNHILCQNRVLFYLLQGMEKISWTRSYIKANDRPMCSVPKEQCGNFWLCQPSEDEKTVVNT